MDEADDSNDIRSKDNNEKGYDSEVQTQQSEPDAIPLSSGELDNESEKDEEKASELLEQGDSPPESLSAPTEKDVIDLDSNDSQNTIEFNDEQNAKEQVGSGSISLSALISTIIKGTVASMDDVGKDKPSLLKDPEAISSGEIVSSSELQDEALSSATDSQTSATDTAQATATVQYTVLQANGDEVLETTLNPAYDPAVGSYMRGRGRRGRMQHRFTMSWNRQHEETNEVAQTKTIDTDRGRIYQCVSCKVSFNYEQDMRMHLQTHLRPRYFCPVCSRRFLNQSTLERHMVTHDQTKPYVCSICSQGFRIKSNLNRHYQRIHNTKVDIGEPRPRRTMSSMSKASMATQEDNLTAPDFPTTNLGKAHRPIPQSYSSPSSYRSSQVPRFAAPQIDSHPNLHYEQMAIPPEPNSNVVSSTERIADLQSHRPFEFDQSPYITPEQNEPNDPLPQRRVADDDESYAHQFCSRYPDVESAVDAIRRIETERLFHQELLLEELKLRRKYGLPSSSVLDDLKKEIAVKERIGDLDSLIAQANGDFGGPQPLRNVKAVHDPNTMTESSLSISPHPQLFDLSYQMMDRPARDDYLMGELHGRRENEEITSRSVPSDILHGQAQDIMYESQASAQLRRLSGYNAARQPAYRLASNRGSPGDFSSAGDAQFVSSQIPGESSRDWSASQRLKALTPPVGRSRRGRRRLSSMTHGNISTFPPEYASESEIQQQRFAYPPRRVRPPAPLSQVVHHRPALSQGPPQTLPPLPRMRPPPLPFISQRDSSHRVVANLPPPPDYVIPSSPRYPEPKRFRLTLQQPTTAELQNQERNSLEVLRPTLGIHPSQSNRASSVGNGHSPGVSNPFTMSGPPNRSLKPAVGDSAPSSQTPHTSPALCTITQDTPPASKHTNGEPENIYASPLDLSQKI